MHRTLAGNQKLFVFALLLIPALFNDFTNIYIKDYATWLAVDYGYRIAQLFVLFYLTTTHRLSWADIGLKRIPLRTFVVFTLGLFLFAFVVDVPLSKYLTKAFPDAHFGVIPYDHLSPLYLFDMTFGLALVALSEEMVIRGLGFRVLRERFGTASAYVCSSILFGLMHWSGGPSAIIGSMAVGFIYCISPHRTKSIWPVIVAHTLHNMLWYQLY